MISTPQHLDSKENLKYNNDRCIRPSFYYHNFQLNCIDQASFLDLKSNGFTIIDNVLSTEMVQHVREQLLKSSSSSSTKTINSKFKKTVQATTTRTDKICWLHENDSDLADEVVDLILKMKGIAWELEKHERGQVVQEKMFETKTTAVDAGSGKAVSPSLAKCDSEKKDGARESRPKGNESKEKDSETLEPSSSNKMTSNLRLETPLFSLHVPQRLMASIYTPTPNVNDGVSSGTGGYVAHRDYCPPEDDDMFWCWKSDPEQSEREITAILYLTPPDWLRPIEPENGIQKPKGLIQTSADSEVGTDCGIGSAFHQSLHQNGGKAQYSSYGGQLRIYPEAQPVNSVSKTKQLVDMLEQEGRFIDIEPVCGRLVLFNSKKLLHAVLPIHDETAPVRLALSCWIMKPPHRPPPSNYA